jgi:hypothetical protein
MPSRCRLLLLASALALLVGCQASGGLGRPSPSDVALARGDVPKDLTRCSFSGTLDGYLQRIQSRDGASASEARDSWAQAARLGATGAAIAGYGATAADCAVGLGRSSGRSAATWVIVCSDQEAAVRVYQHGLLGFPTPSGEREQPELVVGVATGLGPNAWTLHLDQPAPGIYVTFWQDREFATFLVTVGVDAAASHQMALAVDNRIG